MSDHEISVAAQRTAVQAARKKNLFLPHAIRQMSRLDRVISCLILGIDLEGRPVHVVCSPKPEFLAIITASPPSPKSGMHRSK